MPTKRSREENEQHALSQPSDDTSPLTTQQERRKQNGYKEIQSIKSEVLGWVTDDYTLTRFLQAWQGVEQVFSTPLHSYPQKPPFHSTWLILTLHVY